VVCHCTVPINKAVGLGGLLREMALPGSLDQGSFPSPLRIDMVAGVYIAGTSLPQCTTDLASRWS
jgi:hypothetical protein